MVVETLFFQELFYRDLDDVLDRLKAHLLAFPAKILLQCQLPDLPVYDVLFLFHLAAEVNI